MKKKVIKVNRLKITELWEKKMGCYLNVKSFCDYFGISRTMFHFMVKDGLSLHTLDDIEEEFGVSRMDFCDYE